ncbi:MAG: hypothetical protein NTV34_03915 [Proteobacteria bacterium]|nr:hypothetical protein [Pseudomonadota bacterium]
MKNFLLFAALVAALIGVMSQGALCYAVDDAGRDASEFENSIIVLSATRANPDLDAPWNIQNVDVTGFIGVVLSPDKILAPATLVTRSVFIQGQMTDEVAKIPLKVLLVDYEANLAVLTPVDGPLPGVKPLAIGEDLPLNSDVWMVGIENDKQLMRASVRIVEVGMREVIPGGQACCLMPLRVNHARSAVVSRLFDTASLLVFVLV